MIIDNLDVTRWPEIAPIVKEEFGDDMPTNPLQSTFLSVIDGSKLAAFLHVEELLHINAGYVFPDYRDQGFAELLVREAVARIPAGFSAIWMQPEGQGGADVAKRLGARLLGTYAVHRKDG